MVMRLALENAELNAALRESRGELVDARARIIVASDRARRTLERDLHDGAQQRLTAIQIKLEMAQECALDEDLVDSSNRSAPISSSRSTSCERWRAVSTRPCSGTRVSPTLSAR